MRRYVDDMDNVNVLLLALEDFVPVALNAVALWLLARTSLRLDRRAGMYVSASLILLAVGGLTKPTYKLILALSDRASDFAILDDLLFWFLAPGFILLTTGLRAAFAADQQRASAVGLGGLMVATVVIVAAGSILALDSDAWFVLLLAVATLANVLAVAVLMRWSSNKQDRWGVAFYAGSLAIVFGLAWAAASLEQTIPVQWGEQLSSTASQALFLTASVRLTRRVSTPTDPGADLVEGTKVSARSFDL